MGDGIGAGNLGTKHQMLKMIDIVPRDIPEMRPELHGEMLIVSKHAPRLGVADLRTLIQDPTLRDAANAYLREDGSIEAVQDALTKLNVRPSTANNVIEVLQRAVAARNADVGEFD